MATAEAHLRAYDTKAQIALAAFILSLNPLWAMFHTVCTKGMDPRVVLVVLIAVVVTVVAYVLAVWPGSFKRGTSAAPSSLFYLPGDPTATVEAHLSKLRKVNLDQTFAGEVLKLSALRRSKALRLKVAFCFTVGAYLLLLGIFIAGRQCL